MKFPSEKAIKQDTQRVWKNCISGCSFEEYPKKLCSFERHMAEIVRAYSMGCKILILNHVANRYTKEELKKLKEVICFVKGKRNFSIVIGIQL